jgi:putative acetyltransferase
MPPSPSSGRDKVVNDVTIQIERPDQPDVVALLAASDRYTAALYPAESNHMLDVAGLLLPEVTFVVARLDGKALGCASLVKKSDDYAEIKRMYVDDAARGSGLGKRLMAALNEQAGHLGVDYLRLETGIHQPEAIALYHRDGFSDIGPFGDYQPDALSIFMEKRL